MKKNHFFAVLFFLVLNTVLAQNPYLSVNSVGSSQVIEGNQIAYRLFLSGAIATPVSVTVFTTTETASNTDFTAINTTVTIPAGQTMSAIFYVSTTSDLIPEPDEYFKLNATVTSGNTSNATNSDYGYIKDDDTIPTLFSSSSTNKYEGAGALVLTYNLSNPYNSDITFTCLSSNDTAGSSDFTAFNTTLTIPAGQTSVNLSITIADDALIESDETFIVNANVTTANTTMLFLPKRLEY